MTKKEDNKYMMFKNFMHNELGITKEDIRMWIHESVTKEVKNIVEKAYGDFNMRDIIREVIFDRYGNNLKSDIKREVVDQLFKCTEITINIDKNKDKKDV